MSGGDRVFGIVNGILLAIVTLVVLYPLYFSLIASFSSPQAVYQERDSAPRRDHAAGL